MRKKILVKGPILSRSGYGVQSRFAIAALKSRPDLFDIYLQNLNWGGTGQISDSTREWVDETALKTVIYRQQGGQFDLSLQITIPNEFEKMAPINIGYTAGIETTKVAPQWIAKTNEVVDKLIVVSSHSKNVFENTKYDVKNQKGEEFPGWGLQKPVEVVNFPTTDTVAEPLEINIVTDTNFLVVSQWGPRKNIERTITGFIDQFRDDENVGLILKTNSANDSTMDREYTATRLTRLLKNCGEYNCKIYFIHGELTDGNLTWLYQHPTMKALINISHGEGFGLPLFEAAQSGLPLITITWSGQLDFICKPNKKGKNVPKAIRVDYDIKPVQADAVWDGVIQKDSMWAFAKENSYKKALKSSLEKEKHHRQEADVLRKHILKNFTPEKQYGEFVEALGFGAPLQKVDYVFVSDMFKDQHIGGAELSLDALQKECPGTQTTINSSNLTKEMLDFNKDATWVFGNIAQVTSPQILKDVIESGIKYHFIEFDYKFCEYRNPLLYQMLEDEECDYNATEHGQLISEFINNSVKTHFMSQSQLDIYNESLKDLDQNRMAVLSSIFDDDFFTKVETLRETLLEAEDRTKFIVLGSRSWVKGFADSEKWCKNNEVEYEVINGLPHEEVLEKLSEAKGICFKPTGLDTCPRYVIEAKLLGCELELNDNVQHLTEPWFDTDNIEDIVTYLKERRNVFWDNVKQA
tara:strand:- start:1048 stop:3129 length:2082 start_codon:yes stop_codon:yes gene_type:complete